MEPLANQECEACSPTATKLDDQEIHELLPEISSWQLVVIDAIPHLKRVYRFKNFADALSFTNRVGELAESVGHHPSILTEWGRVTVEWWSHEIGGLHKTDFILAARTDQAFA
ncbi:MAG: 4a-hydroxytetrahydrobiopterin dehydratase [Litorivicinus sp.]